MRGTVKTNGLNVRADPNMGGKIRDQISKGDRLYVGGTSENGQWLFVQVIKTFQWGWVFAADVILDKPAPLPKPPAPTLTKAERDRAFWLGGIAVAAMVALLFLARRWFGA